MSVHISRMRVVDPLSKDLRSVKALIFVDNDVVGMAEAEGRMPDFGAVPGSFRCNPRRSVLQIKLVGTEKYVSKRRSNKTCSVSLVTLGAATCALHLVPSCSPLAVESVDGRPCSGRLAIDVVVTSGEDESLVGMEEEKEERRRRSSARRSSDSLTKVSAFAAMKEGGDLVARGAKETLDVLTTLGVDYQTDNLDRIYTALGSRTFVDLDFPPIRGDYQWRRPSEVWDEVPVLFKNGIEPDDVQQGGVADCWLMSALGAVAEFPDLVEKCFDLTCYRKKRCGLYRLRLCQGGQWRRVTVDDFFPYENGQFVYSRSNERELWPLLLEKAMAKLCGDYDRLAQGYAHDALVDITGAPAIRYQIDTDIKKPRDFFHFLQVADKSDMIMSASTRVEGRRFGLVPSHAYSLIAVVEWPFQNHDGGADVGIVQLRNPWKSVEWRGECSDDDPRWNDPDVKARVAASLGRDPAEMRWEQDDGSFWMPFKDFFTHFKNLSLCLPHVPHSKEPWYEYRRRCSFEMTQRPNRIFLAQIFKLKLSEMSMAFVMAHQPDARVQGAPREYSDLAITIFQKKRGGGERGSETWGGGDDDDYAYFDSVSPSLQRQVVCPRIEPISEELRGDDPTRKWEAGEYVIVVWSALCKGLRRPNYDESSWPRDSDANWLTRNAITEIFDRFDSDFKGYLNENDKQLLRRRIKAIDHDDDIVTESDFRTWILTRRDRWYQFHELGYEGNGPDQSPVLRTHVPVVVSVHSEHIADLHVQPKKHNESLINHLLERAQTDMATETELRHKKIPNGKIEVYQSPGGCGLSIVARNFSPNLRLRITLDATMSVNLAARSEDGSLVVRNQIIGANQAKALLHLAPKDPFLDSEVNFEHQVEELKDVEVPATIVYRDSSSEEPKRICFDNGDEAGKRWIQLFGKKKKGFPVIPLPTRKAGVLFLQDHTGPHKYHPMEEIGNTQPLKEYFHKLAPAVRFLIDTSVSARSNEEPTDTVLSAMIRSDSEDKGSAGRPSLLSHFGSKKKLVKDSSWKRYSRDSGSKKRLFQRVFGWH